MEKLKNIVFDLVTEEMKNKTLATALLQKWSEQKQDITPDDVEELYNLFSRIQNNLNAEQPAVVSFFNNFGENIFNPNWLKMIDKYTYEQIKYLLGYFYKEVGSKVEGPDKFPDLKGKQTPEKVESSKELWRGNDDLIINEDGFRVYDPGNESTAIKFGYYAESINNNIHGSNAVWCVTWRNQHGSNRWSNYRGMGRTFYFVIDESRSTSDKYYLSALQKSTNTHSGYQLTSVMNDGDTSMSWEEIVSIYPKLSPYKDLIKSKEFSDDEVGTINEVDRINETAAAGRYQFKRVSKELKLAYINGGKNLSTVDSWKSMDEELRNLYIVLSGNNNENIIDRYNNYEFLSLVKQTSGNLLDNKLKQLGHKEGMGYIIIKLMKDEFLDARIGLKNSKIVLYKSKRTGKYGIFDLNKNSWVDHNGSLFEPEYNKIVTVIHVDMEGEPYVADVFDRGSSSSNNSFYSIYPVDNPGEGYFLSHEKWTALSELLSEPEEEEDIKEINR